MTASLTNAPIAVKYLADCPELIPLLASWFYAEFRRPDLSVEQIERRLHAGLNRDCLPLVLVGFRERQPVASASLKLQEMDIHPEYLHWLGSVYVRPKERNQGIGSYLVEYAASEARRLGIEELYLYTTYSERLYARLGWIALERVEYHGRFRVVMKRTLERNRDEP
jgi:GNAT superfamily N-acetyltransferase